MKPFRFQFILSGIILWGLPFVSCSQSTEPDLKKLWEKVDSFEKDGLPQSELQVVDQIYNSALKAHNQPNLLKAMIYHVKLLNDLHPDTLPGLITWTAQQRDQLNTEGCALLNSMLAEMYWQYYSNNRWKIQERTRVEDEKPSNDLTTWDYRQFADTARSLYLRSITPVNKLQKTPVADYYLLIEKGTADAKERPSLYDFLVNRALQFFENNESALNFSAEPLNFENLQPFAPAKEFVNTRFFGDTAMHPHALITHIYQQWLSFRLKDDWNVDALFFADMQRLNFYYQNSALENKDDLYEAALLNLIGQYNQPTLKASAQLELARLYNQLSGHFKRDDATTIKFQNYKKKARQLCLAILKSKPGKPMETEAQILLDEIEKPDLSFETYEVLIPNQTIAMKLTYCNVAKVYLKIIKTDNVKIRQIEQSRDRTEAYFELLKKNPVILSKTFDLPQTDDYMPVSTELLFPGLDAGRYVVYLSNSPDFDLRNAQMGYSDLRVSNIAYLQCNSLGGVRFYLTNRTTGEPISGVEAKTYVRTNRYDWRDRTYTKWGVFKADKQGFITISNNDDTYSRGFYVEFINNNDTLVTGTDFNTYGSSYSDDNAAPDAQNQIFLFTDRAIYRPGQVVWFKGIAIEKQGQNKNKLLAGFETTVRLMDASYQKVAEIAVKTNDYGSFSGSFVLPQSGLNGSMSLVTDNGSVNIQVEEYKRPTFEVKMDKPQSQFRLDDSVTIRGNAMGYNGVPVAGANVKFRITRNPQWRWWWMPVGEPKPIDFGNLITDADGNFSISFKMKSGKNKVQPFERFTFSISTDVTNSAGETRSQNLSISVGGEALKLTAQLPEKVAVTSVESWKISVQNPEGEKLKTNVTITVERLENPTKAILTRPWDEPDTLMYNQSTYSQLMNGYEFGKTYDYSHLKPVETVQSSTLTVDGTGNFLPTELKKWEPGIYKLTLMATDTFGQKVKTENYTVVYHPKALKVPYPQIDWFVGCPNKLMPGETATIQLGSSEKTAVLVQVEFNGQMLQTEKMELNNNIKSFSFPVTENLRGGFAIHTVSVFEGKVYSHLQNVDVPFTNKELKLSWSTFRDKLLPGQKETWQLTIESPGGEKPMAELLASMYDASLDQFISHNWMFDVFNHNWYSEYWRKIQFGTIEGQLIDQETNEYPEIKQKSYGTINWFGFLYGNFGGFIRGRNQPMMMKAGLSEEVEDEVTVFCMVEEMHDSVTETGSQMDYKMKTQSVPQEEKKTKEVPLRTNFNETAFFYPHLYSDSTGKVTITFTLPESLTRWKFMALAHNKELASGYLEQEVVAQKELMAEVQAPRFVVQGDQITLPVKVQNMSTGPMSGFVELELTDALSGEPLTLIGKDKLKQPFQCKPSETAIVLYSFVIPDTLSSLQYKVTASAGNFSDGEQRWIPVLGNRILVTETRPLWVNGNQTKTFNLNKLQSNTSTTLRHHQLTLEMTANPAWYAIQSLPYLGQPTNQCSEQQFAAFYANAISAYIVQKMPAIKMMFDQWKRSESKESVLAQLDKNPELKQTILNETPWVADALSEKEQRQRIAILFDVNQVASRQQEYYYNLKSAQLGNGAWPWFPGMYGSRYITQYIASGLGHLRHLGILTETDSDVLNLAQNAIRYLDGEIINDYNEYLEQDKKHPFKDEINSLQIQYLYLRSFYNDYEMSQETKDAMFHYAKLGKEQWLKQPKYLQAQLALFFFRNHDEELAQKITSSIKEFALYSDEMGRYWKENVAGYYWYETPVEFQSQMIELFTETGSAPGFIDELKVWLLKNRQANAWHNTKATSEAIYALLLNGTSWIEDTPKLAITIGDKTISKEEFAKRSEPGTGYFKTTWTGNQITGDMGKITIERMGAGISWGSLFWQYFEQIDKVSPASTSLSVKKELFVEKYTPAGLAMTPVTNQNTLKVGDKMVVRLTLKTDWALEYVALKDNRPACAEPVDVLSGYKYQSGLGYYQETRDVATNFYFDYMRAGTYTLEYRINITHSGDFSVGLANIQCMYAPEFSAHSEGKRLKVE